MDEVDVGAVVSVDYFIVNRCISFVYQEYLYQAVCTEGIALCIGLGSDNFSVTVLQQKEY